MSIVGIFTNQTAQYQPQIGQDYAGVATYGPAVTIPCRKERRHRHVPTSEGLILSPYTTVLIEGRANVGDFIDGQRVEAVEDIIDMGGTQLGTECYL